MPSLSCITIEHYLISLIPCDLSNNFAYKIREGLSHLCEDENAFSDHFRVEVCALNSIPLLFALWIIQIWNDLRCFCAQSQLKLFTCILYCRCKMFDVNLVYLCWIYMKYNVNGKGFAFWNNYMVYAK